MSTLGLRLDSFLLLPKAAGFAGVHPVEVAGLPHGTQGGQRFFDKKSALTTLRASILGKRLTELCFQCGNSLSQDVYLCRQSDKALPDRNFF